eukprot:gnl/Spiro4/13561_TR7225_c0_g1_i1.p1 gnl/Spiro4/13561_TR7225_c0_g1~~gnl/Spiro4/13561_TR7225_c0_g1_i1.p1  ORF type:complete len:144 (-),score=7.83 gnl/Spiro4/13561_TR7225_c0_g1_i1:19-450(-)
MLMSSDNVERVIRLSDLVIDFRIEKADTDLAYGARGCSFRFTERVNVCCCITKDVELKVMQQHWADPGPLPTYQLLYESKAGNVHVRKRRIITSRGGGCTVSERVEGHCTPLLAPLVQQITRNAHRRHMDGFASLFSYAPPGN